MRKHRPRIYELPQRACFLNASMALVAIFASAGAPTALYVYFQSQYGIPDSALSSAFAAYILGAAGSLLATGRALDHVGRRPVAITALLIGVVGHLVLAQVSSAPLLIVGRVLQGVSTGVAMPSLGAYIIDLQPLRARNLAAVITSAAPTAGVAVGALASGMLVDRIPDPARLVFYSWAVFLLLSAGGLILSGETSPLLGRQRSRPRSRLTVPLPVRPVFNGVALAFASSWAVAGFYQALSPTLSARILGLSGGVASVLTIATMVGSTVIGGPATTRLAPHIAAMSGLAVLVMGLGQIWAGLYLRSLPVFLVGSAMAGVGFGAACGGGMRTLLVGTCLPDRARALSVLYLVAFTGSATPNFAVGFFIQHGDAVTIFGAYVLMVTALACLAARLLWRGSRPNG